MYKLGLFLVLVSIGLHKAESLFWPDVSTPCTQHKYAHIYSESRKAGPPKCNFSWHNNLSPAVRFYLDRILDIHADARTPSLAFSFKVHNHHVWGSINTWINLYASMAIGMNRTFTLIDRGFMMRPRMSHRGWYLYMQEQPRPCSLFLGSKCVTNKQYGDDVAFNYSMYTPPWQSKSLPADELERLGAWRSALANFQFCPRPYAMAEARCRQKAMGLENGEYIAMHIRRGDKQTGEGKRIPAHEYFEAAKSIRSRSPNSCCKTVYVAYDDESAREEIVGAASEAGFRLVFDKYEAPMRRGEPLWRGWKTANGQAAFSDQLNSIKNMVLFSDAYALIGADMSTYFRFAHALRGLDRNETTISLFKNQQVPEWKPL